MTETSVASEPRPAAIRVERIDSTTLGGSTVVVLAGRCDGFLTAETGLELASPHTTARII
jgi:hypothetical protein